MCIFLGIFICATNAIETVDRAALRRFDVKVTFLPLDLKQRLERFRLAAAELDTPHEAEARATDDRGPAILE